MHNNCVRGLKFNSIEQSPFSQWESRSSCGVSEEPGGLPKQGDLSLYFSTLKDNSLSCLVLWFCAELLTDYYTVCSASGKPLRFEGISETDRRNLSGSGPGGPSPLLADLVRGTKSARTPAVCGKVEGPCGVAWWTAGKKWLASESAQVNASGCPNKTQIKNSCCLASGLRVCLARDLARTYPACRATFTLPSRKRVFSWGVKVALQAG